MSDASEQPSLPPVVERRYSAAALLAMERKKREAGSSRSISVPCDLEQKRSSFLQNRSMSLPGDANDLRQSTKYNAAALLAAERSRRRRSSSSSESGDSDAGSVDNRNIVYLEDDIPEEEEDENPKADEMGNVDLKDKERDEKSTKPLAAMENIPQNQKSRAAVLDKLPPPKDRMQKEVNPAKMSRSSSF